MPLYSEIAEATRLSLEQIKHYMIVLADPGLAARLPITIKWPAFDGPELQDKLADLSHILERGDHTCTRSCDKQRQSLRSEFENTQSVYLSWASMLEAQLRWRSDRRRDAQERIETITSKLKKAQTQLKEQEELLKSIGIFTRIHNGWEEIIKGTHTDFEAEHTDRGAISASAISLLGTKMVDFQHEVLRDSGGLTRAEEG